METAIFAAGCFWGVEETFRNTKGVISTEVGYTGGQTKNPSYEEVCTDETRHAEAVKIVFNPKIISYRKLMDIFWDLHDPTTLDRQGPDIGSQYRSAIFYLNDEQKKEAEISLKKQPDHERIVTEITKADEFYPAEDYHQKYLMKKGQKTC